MLAVDNTNGDKPGVIERLFYGTVTVGERGQIVIPAKARRDFGIDNGDQLLIMGHPGKKGLMIMRTDSLRAFLTEVIGDLQFIESQHMNGSDAIDQESAALTPLHSEETSE